MDDFHWERAQLGQTATAKNIRRKSMKRDKSPCIRLVIHTGYVVHCNHKCSDSVALERKKEIVSTTKAVANFDKPKIFRRKRNETEREGAKSRSEEMEITKKKQARRCRWS